MAWYVDTSAFFKLVQNEVHADAFRAWAEADPSPMLVSSELLITEALRGARRAALAAVALARIKLTTIHLCSLDAADLARAADLDPAILRSLDALHLTAALTFGEDLEGIVTYDDRLADAARLHGVRVESPGRQPLVATGPEA